MIDIYGKWHEEKDYSTYPKGEWCDYDTMAAWIRERGYEPETSMENLINMIFLHYDNKLDDDGECNISIYTDGCKEFVEESGGLEEFDYEV